MSVPVERHMHPKAHWEATAAAVPDTPEHLPEPMEALDVEPWAAAEPLVADTPLPQAGAPAEVAKATESKAAASEVQAPAPAEQADKPVVESAHPAGEPAAVLAGEEHPRDPEDADDVMTKRLPGSEEEDAAVLAASRRHTRRSFLAAGAAVAAGYGFYAYLEHGPQKEMLASPLRDVLDVNAKLTRALFDGKPLAPTYPLSRAENLRVNGIFGLKKMLVPGSWRLQVVGVRGAAASPKYVADVTAWQYRYHGSTMGTESNHDTKTAPKPEQAEVSETPGPGGQTRGMPNQSSSIKMAPMPMLHQAMADEAKGADDEKGEDDDHLGRMPRGMEESGESDSTLRAGTPGLLLVMDDILKLPRHEFVTQFKCIEGWSQIVRWAGVRMADFLELYPPALIDGRDPNYVYMETPDGDYYTGYTLQALRHPQALLVTEMMGAPLTPVHGAPLRLHMPTKYGYKQIKRIGLIAYTNTKPDDYWTKLGYDWYADL